MKDDYFANIGPIQFELFPFNIQNNNELEKVMFGCPYLV